MLTAVIINDALTDIAENKNQYGVARRLLEYILSFRTYNNVYDEIEAGYFPMEDTYDVNKALYHACKKNNWDQISCFMADGADDYYEAMIGAQECGHKELEDYFKERWQYDKLYYNMNYNGKGSNVLRYST